MLERYALPEISRVFSDEHRFELWRRVETEVLRAQAALGEVPEWVVDPVGRTPAPPPEAVAACEAVTRHDVIAFLTAWSRRVEPPEAAAYIHFGMTSSDLVDTALSLQLVEASDILLRKADTLVAVLRDHGLAHRGTVRVGRTHGIHGEPTVWGHRVADFAFAVARSRDRLRQAADAVAVAKLSGPVGTYSSIPAPVESRAAAALGLRPADTATQVYLRDNVAAWVNALTVLATVCEAIAVEIRHGQRTEVGELSERFADGQKGSSAMPHKRNPVTSERICGLARIVRAQAVPVMEGIALWHERDISHSSVERIALPTAAVLTDYLLHATATTMRDLVVDKERMSANVDLTGGLVYSSTALLALIADGRPREQAYALVQTSARQSWQDRLPWRDVLRRQAKELDIALNEELLDRCCTPEHHVRGLGPVFDRLAALR
ncbi:adenylosuccinate lyase [Dactylosporangium cerinum]|uniref:Adenylosuccinate lyase n=1 Tax=Dactylosporangium cerinum TaxID=1434730 RepID=A0ABV9VRI0_9ACTN